MFTIFEEFSKIIIFQIWIFSQKRQILDQKFGVQKVFRKKIAEKKFLDLRWF